MENVTLVYNKGATALGGLKDMARQLRRLPTVDLELPTVGTSVRDSIAARFSFSTLHAGFQSSQILKLSAVVVFEASGVTHFPGCLSWRTPSLMLTIGSVGSGNAYLLQPDISGAGGAGWGPKCGQVVTGADPVVRSA